MNGMLIKRLNSFHVAPVCGTCKLYGSKMCEYKPEPHHLRCEPLRWI